MNKAELEERIKLLEAENSKLVKINTALMTRVEQAGSNLDPYSAFESAVYLEKQVKEKTAALNSTLAKLERSNRELIKAHEKTNILQLHFIDAIEKITDPFVLLDNEGRIVLQNSHFKEFWRDSQLSINKGMNLKDFKELAKSKGFIRKAAPGNDSENPVYQLADGRWFQVNEQRTVEGGWVILYTDITAVKTAETLRYNHVIAEKSKQLQNLVDNLAQGVVLLSEHKQVMVWNKKFLEMSQLSEEILKSKPYINTLIPLTALNLSINELQNASEIQVLSDTMVLETKSYSLPDSTYIKTFTDITEQHQYAESLKTSEQWLRLITDNVPAMIAYIGADFKIQFVNRVYANWYGKEQSQLLGLSLKQTRTLEDYKNLEPYLLEALNGESVSFEVEEKALSGHISYLLKSYVPNKDKYNQVQGIFVLIRDITERRLSALNLQEAHDKLELRVSQRTSQLRQEVEVRKSIQNNLLQAKQEAEQASLSKSKFLAAVSHDLIQPLNAAQLFTSMLQEQITEQAHTHRLVLSVADSLDNLERLISSLVDISKLDAGIIIADKSMFNIDELLSKIITQYQQTELNSTLQLRYVASSCRVYSDSTLLARIVRNFISNAYRYTQTGKILVGCRRSENDLWLQVLDTGIGLTKQEQVEIFKEFKRGEIGQTLFSNGLGLGLAIVDKLAKVLDTEIKVRSILGKGAMFSVKLPLANQCDGNLTRASFNPAFESLEGNTQLLQNAKVWLVDNDLPLCASLTETLRNWGCDVKAAHSFESLVDEVDVINDPVDILLVDYHLDNNVTGLQLTEKLKQLKGSLPETIMITANHSTELRRKLIESRFTLLNKPIKPAKLRATLLFALKA